MARRLLAFALTVAVLGLAAPGQAADSEVETLRAQLRSTVLQLRQLQDQQAQAAATPSPASPDTAALKAQLAAARAQLAAARRAQAGSPALQAQLDKAKADNAALTAAATARDQELEKFRAAFSEAATREKTLTAERDRLTVQLRAVISAASACQEKNARLVRFSQEMLNAYNRVTLGGQLVAREPFLGLMRVQLENIAQDREDTIAANRCDFRLDSNKVDASATPVTASAP